MNNKVFAFTILLSMTLHGGLLLNIPNKVKQIQDVTHYAKTKSQRITVKRVLNLKKTQRLDKKRKQLKSEIKSRKKLVKKKVVIKPRPISETALVKQNSLNRGQQDEKARYLKKIRDQILARKKYPRVAKMLKKQGIVDIYFEVSYPKNLSNIQIQKGSGYEILDRSALETVRMLEELPEMPSFLKSETLKVAIPIKYELL